MFVDFKLENDSKNTFKEAKDAIVQGTGLVSHDYSNPFQIFNFEYANTIARFLLQKNNQNEERTIAFTR